ncbi:hypothetical protein SAY86_023754 [Trapa natans]|uniref:Protein kinase domain-containing protein n=1 Tax=Trapa natans TaxID=22666 RepID=A0AAN7LXV4_TRANT|nr:hypothetical protein SAY86_023754 [Trapa natans]
MNDHFKQNLLLSTGDDRSVLKIADFGFARRNDISDGWVANSSRVLKGSPSTELSHQLQLPTLLESTNFETYMVMGTKITQRQILELKSEAKGWIYPCGFGVQANLEGAQGSSYLLQHHKLLISGRLVAVGLLQRRCTVNGKEEYTPHSKLHFPCSEAERRASLFSFVSLFPPTPTGPLFHLQPSPVH